MLGRVKLGIRNTIGYYRQALPVKALHEVAAFIESAYSNEGSSFEQNGERRLIYKLRTANFGTAFDVGANFGDWTTSAVKAWPNCHVHAFEVAPVTYKTLEEHIQSSEYRNRITLNCFGLSDADSTMPMYFYPDHPELTCDNPRHGDSAVAFSASLRAGDGYVLSRGIDTIDFLKIDVEGAEYRVLKGLERFLSDAKVHCIQFEYGAFATQTRMLLADFYSLLGSKYWIGKIYPTYVEFRDYDWRMEDFHFANYLCVSRSREDLRRMLESA